MLKKIRSEQLRVGMHLHELCGSWVDHPFWRAKFVIEAQSDIDKIIQSGIAEAWIDTELGGDVEAPPPAPAPVADPPAAVVVDKPAQRETHEKTSFSGEMRRAAKIVNEGKEAVVSMFNEVRMGKAISSQVAKELVDEISASVMRNSGALISLARLKTADDYTYMHSVAVCALMVSLAHKLDLDEDATREAGMGGLLHDLGKAVMPMEVLNKPGKLTDEEFAIIKSHPVEGHRLLLEAGTAGEVPLDICLHHHEKTNGRGYPHGLKDEQITLFAKMGAVCDVYDAITSNRPYKAGWDPAESIRRMTEWSDGHFDPRVFQAFVKSIGIYPTGSLVKLASGRLGVVIEQSEKSLLAPKVKVFFSTKSKLYIPPELIDLSRPDARDKIVGREEAATWGISDIDRFWAQPA